MARGPKPKADKPPKAAKAKAGHNNPAELDKGTFLEHARNATISLRELEEAQSRHQQVLKKAKAAGCNPKVLMKVIRARRDPEAAGLELQAELRYRQWIGLPLGTQSSMFDDANAGDEHLTDRDRLDQAIFDADEAGYKAGRSGQGRDDNPHPAGTETHVQWDKSYLKGQAAIAAEMGENVTQITAARGADAAARAAGKKVH